MSSKSPGQEDRDVQENQSSSSSSNSDEDEYSIEDNSEAVTNSSSSIGDSSDSAEEEEEEELDDFDQFLKCPRGKFQSTNHHRVPPLNDVDADMMCFYYFSDALGLNFSSRSEEVYRLDQIKEWDPPESKWLVPPNILGILTTWQTSVFFFKKKPDLGPNTYFVLHEIVIIQKDVVIYYTI